MTSQPREAGAKQASLSHTLVWASSQRGHLRVVVVLLWGTARPPGGRVEAMKILMTWPEKSQNLAMWHSAKSLRLIQLYGEGD